jgi:hypothetical protein
MSPTENPVEPLRRLSAEEASRVVPITEAQICAALKKGEKERDAIETFAQQPQNIDPRVRFR